MTCSGNSSPSTGRDYFPIVSQMYETMRVLSRTWWPRMSKSLQLDGLKLVDLQTFYDERGGLTPINFGALSRHLDVNKFAQMNVASSHQGVIRGMHWQNAPTTQGKLIFVLAGKIIDVVIDIRQSSSTFGQYTSVKLNDGDGTAFWIPPGFAHGFQTLSVSSKVMYLVDAPFDLNSSEGINPLDKEMLLPWDYSIEPILSQKDSSAPNFSKRFG